MTEILALDLGTKTGYCVGSEAVHHSGTADFKNDRFEGGGMRYVKFEKFLNEFHDTYRLKAVYFEEVHRHRGTAAAHAYGGFLATLTAWCEKHKVPYSGVKVQAIKKFWTGKGNAPKEAMIASAVKHGYGVADDNEADAVALFRLKIQDFDE